MKKHKFKKGYLLHTIPIGNVKVLGLFYLNNVAWYRVRLIYGSKSKFDIPESLVLFRTFKEDIKEDRETEKRKREYLNRRLSLKVEKRAENSKIVVSEGKQKISFKGKGKIKLKSR